MPSSPSPAPWPPRPTRPSLLRGFRRTALVARTDHGVFAVERHGVVDGAGRARHDVVTFRCPDWVNVVALTPARELVLVWQHRFGTDALTLECPGGVLEPGEEPVAGALRELREETGYLSVHARRLGYAEPNPALQDNRCHTVLAEGCTATGVTAFDELEDLETVLLPFDAIPRLVDEGHVRHALSVVALERAYRTARATALG